MTPAGNAGPLFAGTVVQWPESLTDEIPMPYTAWRVMNAVDGRRSVQEIAQMVGLSTEQAIYDLTLALDWTGRLQQQFQRVTDELLDTLAQNLMSIVGPMGEFIVDDAAEAAGPDATLSQVLSHVARELDETHLNAYVRLLRSKGLA